MDAKLPIKKLFRSEVQFFDAREGGWLPLGPPTPNALLDASLALMVRLLTGKALVPINAMYLEFENNAGAVTPPTIGDPDDPAYYSSLVSSSVRDYLRVPLIAASTGVANGLESVANFFAQTAGTVGVNGRAFSAAANSKVFGAALVSVPDFANIATDLVFARTYKTGSDQAAKTASTQIGFRWSYTLGD